MSYRSKQMIVMRRDLHMRKGKIAAQAGHACVEAVLMALAAEDRLQSIRRTENGVVLDAETGDISPLVEWFQYGVAKICVYVDSEAELLEIDQKAREMGVISALIMDAGLTEFHGVPTYTCLALEPVDTPLADAITGHLKLY